MGGPTYYPFSSRARRPPLGWNTMGRTLSGNESVVWFSRSWGLGSSWVSYTLLGVSCFIPRVRTYLRSVLPFPRTPRTPRPPLGDHLGDHLIPILGVIMCCMGWLSTTIREGGRRAPLENGVLGHLGHLGYPILYWGCRVSSRGFVLTFDLSFLFQEPKNTKKSNRGGLGAHPLGEVVIPRLGMIMCCMGWLSTTTREGGRRAPLGKHNNTLCGTDTT